MNDLLDLPELAEEDLLELPEIVDPQKNERLTWKELDELLELPTPAAKTNTPNPDKNKFDEPRDPDTYVGEVNDLIDGLRDIPVNLGKMASERFFYHLDFWERDKDPICAKSAIHAVMNMRAGFFEIKTEAQYYIVSASTPDGTLVQLSFFDKEAQKFKNLILDEKGLDKLREKEL